MKIFIDGSTRAAVKRMFSTWKEMGHEVVSNSMKADVQLSVIKISNRIGLPTVLRLDGIYYDKADNNKNRNSEINIAHKTADAVVYQSEMSKIMSEKYLVKRKTNTYNIIYNGVEVGWNNPKQHDDINIVSCAKWRRWKRLPEVIEVFDEFLKHQSKARLYIIGPMKKGAKIIKHKDVIYYNPDRKIDLKEIKKIYRTMDIYLHLAKKDWCPSSVIEAIAAGIPVITTNACGGATEMCKLTKGCVIVYGEKESLESDYIYQDRYNKISKNVKEEMVKHMVQLVKAQSRVILPKELRIETTAKKYIEIMEKIV